MSKVDGVVVVWKVERECETVGGVTMYQRQTTPEYNYNIVKINFR